MFAPLRTIWARLTRSNQPMQTRILVHRHSHSGVAVNEDVALAYSAVWACVRLIAETIEYLPWHVYERTPGGGREMQPEHPLDHILDYKWNPEMDAGRCRRNIVAHALTWGNGYAEKERDNAGRVQALWPITPDRVNPDRVRQTGQLVYDISNPSGPNTVLLPDEIFHLAGLGWDGIMGYSPIMMGAQSIGMGLAMEKFGASYFGSGAMPSGVLTHPGTLSDPAYKRLRDDWAARHNGELKPAILEEGMKWEALSIPPEEAQFLESRKFQVEEICRWYGVPPHKIGQLERATFNNIEHLAIEFVQNAIMPWVDRLERAANTQLIRRNQRNLHTKITIRSLLRGDLKAQSEFYREMINTGIMTPNEARAEMDKNPGPAELDRHYIQGAMIPMAMAGQQQQQPTAPPTDDSQPVNGRQRIITSEITH